MSDISALLTKERKYLADTLAGPLAKMLTADGAPTTKEELEKLILDPDVEIRFPKITIHKLADVQVATSEVEVAVTEVTTSDTTRRLRKLQKKPDK